MSERRSLWWLVATAAALLWSALVVVVYYVPHKPFTVSHLLALGQAGAGLLGAGLLVALGIGIGLLLVNRLDLMPIERPIWAAAVGLGVISLVGLGLGALGLLRTWLLWLLTVVGLAFTGQRLWRMLCLFWADPGWRPRDRFETLLARYCAAVLLLTLAWALTPPTAWDGLVYHLTGPKLYLAEGVVSHPFDLPYLGFPQLVEMLFAWAMGLTGERAAAVIHWSYGLLGVLALVGAGRRWLGGAAAWLAAAMLLSAPSMILLMGWPYVDLALVLYVTLAFLALARFCEGGSQARRWLVLSGVFSVLAMSTKYTAMAVVPAVGLALLASRTWKSGYPVSSIRPAARDLFLWCASVLIVWLPWLFKNLLLTGNPTYPFFFDGVYWDGWRTWWYDRPGTGLWYTKPWRLLIAPWDATVWGIEGASGYSASIGPLFLGLLPFLLPVWRRLPHARRRWLRAALAFCGVLYGFWLWGVARTALLIQTRLLFPAFGLLALVAGVAVEGLRSLPRRPLDLGWLARAVVVGVLALTLLGTFLSAAQGRPLGVLLGFESREEFLTRRLGWYYAAVEHINRELAPDAVVLFLWEPRSYHCDVICRPDALLDRFLHSAYLYGSNADAIAAAWRTEGVTHVLFYRQGYQVVRDVGFDPLTDEDAATVEALCHRHMQAVQTFGDAYVLYELREP